MNKMIFLFVAWAMFFSLCTTIQADQKFSELIEKRHSGYQFDPSKSISKDHILQLAKAARLSPSSYNDQPWRFIICDSKSTPEAYQKALNSLVEPNQKWAKNVPLLIVVCADTISKYNKKPNKWAEYDTGAAAMSLVYQATSLGLMAHEMGGFDQDKIRKEFVIPEYWNPMAVIAVGYELESADAQKGEKERLPLDEVFFLGDLKRGLK